MIEVTIISFEAYTMENLLLDYLEFTKSCVLLQIFVQVLSFFNFFSIFYHFSFNKFFRIFKNKYFLQFFKESMKTQYYDFVTIIVGKSIEMIMALQTTKENSNLEPI